MPSIAAFLNAIGRQCSSSLSCDTVRPSRFCTSRPSSRLLFENVINGVSRDMLREHVNEYRNQRPNRSGARESLRSGVLLIMNKQVRVVPLLLLLLLTGANLQAG
jgi:hypothetical protein